MHTPGSRLDRAVDAAIAEENRRFLADSEAIEDARREGDTYRHRLEDEGILPILSNDEGCSIHE